MTTIVSKLNEGWPRSRSVHIDGRLAGRIVNTNDGLCSVYWYDAEGVDHRHPYGVPRNQAAELIERKHDEVTS